MADQLARGLFANFAPNENPFDSPNDMEDNLRFLDDHIGLYTIAAPAAPGSPLPGTPVPGQGQIFTDGTYAVFNEGNWRFYPACKGILVRAADGSDLWVLSSAGSWVSVKDVISTSASAAAAAYSQLAETFADNAETASVTTGVYPTAAASDVPRGLTQASLGAITPGAGGANGTFALAWVGGNFSINPSGTFTVAGGVLTAVTITGPGLYIGAAPVVPAPSFAASAGLAGAGVVLTAQFLIEAGKGYWVQSSDGKTLDRYKNVGGLATSDTASVESIPTREFFSSLAFPETWRMPLAEVDGNGRATRYTSPSGVTRFATLRARTVNGRRPENAVLAQLPNVGDFLAHQIFMNLSGQSLAEQHVGGANVTLSQEYGSQAFPYEVSDPAQLLSLVATNEALIRAGQGGGAERFGENPMYGMAGFLWELLGKENGITPADVAMRIVTANNALSATGIDSLDKGSVLYNNAIAQATALVATPPAAGQRWRTFGTGWFHGHSDSGFAFYLGKLQTLAKDYAADFRAAMPLQDFDPLFVCDQPSSDTPSADRYSVARAIFKAVCDAEDGVIPGGHIQAPPIRFSTPEYFMDFRYDVVNGVHVKARDSKWLGAYVALVFKRIFIDGGTWPMMRPTLLEIEGGAIFLKFQLRAPSVKLVVAECDADRYNWDGTALPPQTGRGFSAMAGAIPVNWAQLPDVVAPDTIRLIPTVDPATITRIDYGQQPPLHMHPYKGSAGNFRDNYGDFVTYDAINRSMHNWLPVFSIVPDGSPAGFSLDTAEA